MCVRWGNSTSPDFLVGNGVRTLLYTLIQKKHIHTTITPHTHYTHSKYNID